jgi:hypothetical protein
MQALQAVQGLQELKPKGKGTKYRFDIPEDPKERASKRRWLMFKADWLEALLEDALDELEAIDRYEDSGERGSGNEARKHLRQTMEISATYGIGLSGDERVHKLCSVVDVSIGGVKLVLNEQISVNTPVTINLQEGMDLDGTVVWSRKPEEGAKKYNTGVMFTNINEALMNKIEQYLAGHIGDSGQLSP